jgi:PAS domain S-box-containing protein
MNPEVPRFQGSAEAEKLAARRERILHATGEAAGCIAQAPFDAAALEQMLGILGRATEVSRVYLFHIHTDTGPEKIASSFSEWCAPGVSPQHDNPALHNIPLYSAGYGRWIDAFMQGEVVAGPIESFPPEEQPVLQEQGILSLVVMPIQTQHGLWGFIGFDDCAVPQTWPADIVSCLRVAARVLGAAFDRSEYRRRNEALLVEYREVLASIQDVVFKVNEAGQLTYLSKSWTTVTGRPVESSLGASAFDLMKPEVRFLLQENHRRLISGELQSVRMEVPLSLRDGWVQMSVSRIAGSEGRATELVGTLTDISELKAAQDALTKSRLEAESSNRAKSEFLATMSHELRTPLNAVIGLSESMLELLPKIDPDRARRYLGIIHQSGRQLLAQINDVIDLARIDSGNIEVALEPMDLARVASEATDGLRLQAQAKGIEISFLPTSGTLLSLADERLMRQVFRNLIDNAIKFTEPGGLIAVVPRLEDDRVLVEIRDSGIGIPEDKLSQLFKPFTQIDSSLARRHNGTGLGLALVDRIVRLNRGRVRVESVAGRGSTFTVELPRHVRTLTAADPRPRSVLLLDDDARQHTLVCDFLSDQGYAVAHYHEAAAAIRQIGLHPPGVVVVDLNLGAVSGIDVIASLRRLPDGDRLPVLALTASALPEDAARCRAAGANDYLAKPVQLSELLARINALAGIPS